MAGIISETRRSSESVTYAMRRRCKLKRVAVLPPGGTPSCGLLNAGVRFATITLWAQRMSAGDPCGRSKSRPVLYWPREIEKEERPVRLCPGGELSPGPFVKSLHHADFVLYNPLRSGPSWETRSGTKQAEPAKHPTAKTF